MNHRPVRLATFVTAVTLVTATGAVVGVQSASATVGPARSQAQTGPASGARYAPSPSDTAPMDLTIVLTPSSRSQLRALAAQKTTASRAQRAAELARTEPTATTRSNVESTLSAAGFSVTRASTWELRVSASPTTVSNYFNVNFVGSGSGRHADRKPTLPTAFAGRVTAVLGLDQRAVFRRRTIPIGTGGAVGASPTDLRSAYGMPTTADTSYDGHGATVATIQFSGWSKSDLTHYASAATTAGYPLQDPIAAGRLNEIPVDSANPAVPDSGGDLEVALDQEMILAAAPLANQRAYFAPNTSAGSYDVYSQVANDVASANITTLSTSWGSCQSSNSPDYGYQNAVSDAIARAVAAGATTFAAAGDSGADDCQIYPQTSTSGEVSPDVDFPAVLPQVVAVGGTALSRTGSAWTETAWQDAPSLSNPNDPGGATGGGYSHASTAAGTQRPSYQQSINVPYPNATNERLVPDIAATASYRTNYGPYTYYGAAGGAVKVGGTSVGAPLMAGLLAARLTSVGCAGGSGSVAGIGDIHSVLYSHADNVNTGGSHFRDVTSGNNGYQDNDLSLGQPTGFPAGAGYDMASGLGSPQWTGFSNAELLGGVLPTCPVVLSAASLAPGDQADSGSPIDVQLAASGGAGSPYTYLLQTGDSLPPGLSMGPDGHITGQVTTAGSFTFHVIARDRLAQASAPQTFHLTVAGIFGEFTPLTEHRVFSQVVGTTRYPVGLIGNGVPSLATAVAVNVMVTSPTTAGFLRVGPYDTTGKAVWPSTLYYRAGQAVSDFAVVRLVNGSGQVNVSAGSARVSIDVVGFYYDGKYTSTTSTYTPLPQRRIVSKTVGTGRSIVDVAAPAGMPSNTTAAVLNIGITRPTTNGAYIVTPYNATVSPSISTQEYSAGQSTSNLVTVGLVNGAIQVHLTSGTGTVFVDVVGYFAPGSGLKYVQLSPVRAFNTTLTSKTLSLDFTRSSAIPLDAKVVAFNLSLVSPSASGYARVSTYQQTPGVSTQNYLARASTSAFVLAKLTNGVADLVVSAGSAPAYLDLVGYYK